MTPWAHAVFRACSFPAEVLKRFFGTDDISSDAAPVTRTYASFSQAADENAFSRILVGIHFRDAVEQGVKHGRKIARRAAHLLFKPAH